MEELQRRLEAVERQLRWWRLGAFCVAVLAAAALLTRTGQTAEGLGATALNVSDGQGPLMTVTRDRGGAVLNLYNAQRKVCARIGSDPKGPCLTVFSSTGAVVGRFGGWEDLGSLRLADSRGNAHVAVQASPSGGVVAVRNDRKTLAATLGSDGPNSYLSLYGAPQTPGVVLYSAKNAGVIKVNGTGTGKGIAEMGVSQQQGTLRVISSDGTPLLEVPKPQEPPRN
jgi:hypothetical protein